jgi:hypothetical protein
VVGRGRGYVYTLYWLARDRRSSNLVSNWKKPTRCNFKNLWNSVKMVLISPNSGADVNTFGSPSNKATSRCRGALFPVL